MNAYGGTEVTDDDMKAINVRRDPFHGDWNYTIRPQKSARRRRRK